MSRMPCLKINEQTISLLLNVALLSNNSCLTAHLKIDYETCPCTDVQTYRCSESTLGSSQHLGWSPVTYFKASYFCSNTSTRHLCPLLLIYHIIPFMCVRNIQFRINKTLFTTKLSESTYAHNQASFIGGAN